MLMGPLGLNTVPNARMDEAGIMRLTASTLDPYTNVSLGFQIAEPLFVNLRQSMEVPGINADPDRLYPSIDIKLRLAEETSRRPEIALGLQSATGHKRMAGEYLVLSKRFLDFDLSAGIGWGRYGSAGQIDNPLSAIFGHFDKERELDAEMPNIPEDWFTGKKAGLFAGIEYFTPIDGLSLKADIGADRYAAEKAALDFNAPSPWSVGVNYSPAEWINLHAGTLGGDKLFASLNFQSPAGKWPGRSKDKGEPVPFRPYRTGLSLTGEMKKSASRKGVELTSLSRNVNGAAAELHFTHDAPLPRQIGRAARHMANHAGESIESLTVTPVYYGLRGPSVSIIRADLERALGGDNNASPQEIWKNARFNQDIPEDLKKTEGLKEKPLSDFKFSLTSATDISLAEEDSGLLYRSAVLARLSRRIGSQFISGEEWRINFADNLNRLRKYRQRSALPVRADIDDFTARTIATDRAFLGWLTTIRNGFYGSASAGYLEEMYGGIGGEILYRPYGKTYAIGGELWQVFKRDPFTSLNLGFNGDHLMTGHINAWYEFPGSGLTLKASLGRYLAEDLGGSISLMHEFKNGAELEAFATLTDQSDFDIFGGTTHFYNGLRLKLPIGNAGPIPDGSEIRVNAAPLGRDNGQALDKPLSLFELTKPFSRRHMARHWNSVME